MKPAYHHLAKLKTIRQSININLTSSCYTRWMSRKPPEEASQLTDHIARSVEKIIRADTDHLELSKLKRMYQRVSQHLMLKLLPGLELLVKPGQISKPLVFVSIGSGDTHELVCVDVFCQMYSINYRFIAIDIDEQKIIKCAKRFDQFNSNNNQVEFYCRDATNLTDVKKLIGNDSIHMLTLRHPIFGIWNHTFKAYMHRTLDGEEIQCPLNNIIDKVIPSIINSETLIYLSCFRSWEYDQAARHFTAYTNLPAERPAIDDSFKTGSPHGEILHVDGFSTMLDVNKLKLAPIQKQDAQSATISSERPVPSQLFQLPPTPASVADPNHQGQFAGNDSTPTLVN